MIKKISFLVIVLFAGISLLGPGPVFAYWNPTWQINFTDTLGAYKDAFTAGVGGSDGYSIGEDILEVSPPPFPSSPPPGMPVHPYIQMNTTVDGKKLMKDSRANLVQGTAKVWNIDKYKYDPNNVVSGSETIEWVLGAGVPSDVQLTLIDYGNDATRTNPLATADMRTGSSYTITGVTGGTGTYRYLAFKALLSEAAGTISGVVTLQGISAPNLSELITFQLKDHMTGNVISTFNVNTGTDGGYALTEIAPGTYDLTAKGSKWLRKKIGNITVTAGENTVENFLNLKGGDANNTNSINIQDLNILKASYGKSSGQPGYDSRADFNKTNSVNIQDLNLLKGNYGQSGD
jgi:hypothetical protein